MSENYIPKVGDTIRWSQWSSIYDDITVTAINARDNKLTASDGCSTYNYIPTADIQRWGGHWVNKSEPTKAKSSRTHNWTPCKGQVWYNSFREGSVTVLSNVDGVVTYETIGDVMSLEAARQQDFQNMFEFEPAPRALPGKQPKQVYLATYEGLRIENHNDYVSPRVVEFTPEAIKNAVNKTGSNKCTGYLKVPLDWDNAEWVTL